MKKIVAIFFVLGIASVGWAIGPQELQRDSGGKGTTIQGAAPAAALDVLITDNYSHNQSVSGALWYSLNFNGTGTCIVRKMNDTTKASWTAIPVASGTSYARVVGKSMLYLNYSGCAGTTTTKSGTGNSVIEMH